MLRAMAARCRRSPARLKHIGQIEPGANSCVSIPPHAAAADGRVEVIEFFYYGCPCAMRPSRSCPAGSAPA